MDQSLHANVLVQMSGWREVRYQTKDDWKSGTLVFGEQSAATTLTTSMLASPVILSDSGWYGFGITDFSVRYECAMHQTWHTV